MKPEGALFIYNVLIKAGFYGSRKEGFCFFLYTHPPEELFSY